MQYIQLELKIFVGGTISMLYGQGYEMLSLRRRACIHSLNF